MLTQSNLDSILKQVDSFVHKTTLLHLEWNPFVLSHHKDIFKAVLWLQLYQNKYPPREKIDKLKERLLTSINVTDISTSKDNTFIEDGFIYTKKVFDKYGIDSNFNDSDYKLCIKQEPAYACSMC